MKLYWQFCTTVLASLSLSGCGGINPTSLQLTTSSISPSVSSSHTALVAGARAQDAETAAYIATSGRLLYSADGQKQDWGYYCSLATKLVEQGNFRLAVRAASKAFYLGKKNGNNYAKAYAARDLAYAYSLAGDLDTAWRWAEASLNFSRRAKRGTIAKAKVRWRAHKVIGDIEQRRGRIQQSVAAYQEALKQLSKLRATETRRAEVLISLSNASMAQGKWDDANNYLARAEQIGGSVNASLVLRARAKLAGIRGQFAEAAKLNQAVLQTKGPDNAYERVWAHRGIAVANLGLGKTDAAIRSYDNAIAEASQLRSRFRSEEFKAGFFGGVQDVFDEAIDLLMKNGHGTKAFDVAEKARSRSMLDLVRGRVVAAAKGQGKAVVDPVGSPLTASQIRASLTAKSTIVSYYMTQSKIYAWTLKKNGTKAHKLRLNKEKLASLVKKFRAQIEAKGPQVRQLAALLHNNLVAPLRIPRGSTIMLVPHKSLHYLPFTALRSPRGWLIEEHALLTAPSASAIPVLVRKSRQTSDQILAFGNPDIGDPTRTLPGAEREVQQIARVFPNAKTYLRKEATKTRVIAASPTSGIVHLAAHASVDELDPLYSTIRLAPDGKSGGDLEAHEFYRLSLHQTRLVVLSACDSGLGRISSGDEFWGFKRTILGAGASAALVTLWPVYDDSTSALMGTFYEKMKQDPTGSALRSAQLSLVRSKKYSHPVHWAAFTLIGSQVTGS